MGRKKADLKVLADLDDNGKIVHAMVSYRDEPIDAIMWDRYYSGQPALVFAEMCGTGFSEYSDSGTLQPLVEAVGCIATACPEEDWAVKLYKELKEHCGIYE